VKPVRGAAQSVQRWQDSYSSLNSVKKPVSYPEN